MSLNIFAEDDEPLFSTENNDNENIPVDTTQGVPSIEEYNSKQENSRKNKVLTFCFKSSRWVLAFVVFLIIADLFAQAHGWEPTLIKECLSLITYCVTAALGFMFGSNSR